MIVKNVPKENKFFIIFYRLILDGFIFFNYLFRLKFSSALAIIRAHSAFYKTFKYMNQKNITFIKKRDYFYTKNVLSEYFFKRKRYFTDLNK